MKICRAGFGIASGKINKIKLIKLKLKVVEEEVAVAACCVIMSTVTVGQRKKPKRRHTCSAWVKIF